jgi:uncharacterized protein YcfL
MGNEQEQSARKVQRLRFKEGWMKILKGCKWGVAAVFLAGGLGTALGVGGCSTTAAIEATGKKAINRESAPEIDKNVLCPSLKLANDVDIVELKSTTVGGVLQVRASLRISARAKDPDMLPMLYQFVWFDADGKEIAANPGAWIPLMIFGRATETIQGVAPAPRARDFKLLIHEPDDSHC